MGSSAASLKHHIFLTYCHEVVGVAMRWLVQQHFPFSAIDEARSFQKALNDLPKKEYDLIVLDAEMGDTTHLLGTVAHIKSTSPQTRILVFSELEEAIYGPKYLAFGINGYLTKSADIDNIVLAIKKALEGTVHPQTAEPDPLSNREVQIADLLVKGVALTDISKKMNLKDTTISTYKKRIFEKTGVKTLSDLIAVWKIYK